MSSQYSLKMSAEQAKEMPMVDLAFEVLKASKNPYYYRDLMQEIAKIKGLSDEEVMQVIAQLYTEINIDGRFACVGTNLWGLKRWYPVEKSDDAVGTSKHPRIINDDDDDDDYYTEEEETEEEYESFEGGDEFSGEEEDFYQDEEAIDDAEIEEVEGEIEEIDEEAEDDDFEESEDEEEAAEEDEGEDDDDK
ncbi:DNA-directed RNA polymerase subunit delta [Paenibacillus flagellatus]|uniref:Probable DNA-directed RNA polymerase subunit delta n=1 Tax=Paenibacillus flagellatus TaxID=2211139 RepID=A0A2V5K206_9BACL|nr:DNA-directed RNA polymerase subunit delta [Paenibacillus flagellatus]PYI52682.1 DNA-directed RNA polymerase subunit delta [Paenibacillus flagellatus]